MLTGESYIKKKTAEVEAWKNGNKGMYSTKGQNISAEVEAFKNGAPMSSCESGVVTESSGGRWTVNKSNDVRKYVSPVGGGSGDVRSVFQATRSVPQASSSSSTTPRTTPPSTQPAAGKYVPPHLRNK